MMMLLTLWLSSFGETTENNLVVAKIIFFAIPTQVADMCVCVFVCVCVCVCVCVYVCVHASAA